MQAMLPLLSLFLLLPVFQSVDLHGLGGLGFPGTSRTVGQSHACERDNLSRPRCMVILPGTSLPSQVFWEHSGDFLIL